MTGKRQTAENTAGTGVEVEILRDFWDAQGVRQCRGKRLIVGVEAAMDGVESGSLKRVKANE